LGRSAVVCAASASAGCGDCGCGDCLSGKIDPSRAATLPRLLTVSFSLRTGVEPLDFRSGLELGLAVGRGANASRSLPTGEVDRFVFSSLGACRDAVVRTGVEAEGACEEGRAAGDFAGELVALDCSMGRASLGRCDDLMSGDDVVK
jgi:hypothetical protein